MPKFGNAGAEKNTEVFLFPVIAVFTGIFLGLFDVCSHALFLSCFDEKIMARAYIISGIIGFIFTYVNSKLGKKIRCDHLFTINLLLVTVMTLVLWFLMVSIPSDKVIFLVFTLMWPLNVLALNGIIGANELLEREKKLKYSLLNSRAGVLTGIMTGGFLSAFLVSAGLDVRHFLLIGFLFILLSLLIRHFVLRKFIPEGLVIDIRNYTKTDESFIKFLQGNVLFRRIVLFTVLSLITSFFIRYTFMAVARIHYLSEKDLAHFLGLFYASMMIFALIVTSFVCPFLVRHIRLRATITVPVLIIAGLTIASVFTGFISGMHPAASGISSFFVLIGLSGFFSGVFKRSVESSSNCILMQILDKNKRTHAYLTINGTINETGRFFSGLILVAIGILGSVSLVYFQLILVPISLLWLMSGIWLYSEYRKIIHSEAKADSIPDISVESSENNVSWQNRISAGMEFDNDYLDLITGDISALEKNHNLWYIDKIIEYAEIKRDICLLPALKRIRSESAIPRDIRVRTSSIIQDLELLISGIRQNDGRLRARKVLAGDQQPPVSEVLKFLRDRDDDLKIIAFGIIKKFRLNELLSDICACLENPRVRVHAVKTLKSFRESANQELRRFYMLFSGNQIVASSILRIFGYNCSSENIDFLFSLLWSGTRTTREAALSSISSCNYRMTPRDREKLNWLITDVIGVITWNISAGVTISRMDSGKQADAIDQENTRWIDFLFTLLSVSYGKESVNEFRRNLESDTVESYCHALEMMDILFDDQVKTRLKVLFDRLSPQSKLRTLFRFYSGEILDFENLTIAIINRDYNLMGVWLRVCIIRNIPKISTDEMADSFIALLFSPELILRQETARLLSRSGGEFYRKVSDRIPDKLKGMIDQIINEKFPENELVYNKVIFLKSLLDTLPEENLLTLAEELVYTELLLPENLPQENGYILWEYNCQLKEFRERIFYDNILRGISLKENDAFCYVLNLNALTDHLDLFPEHSLEIFKMIDEIERRNQ